MVEGAFLVWHLFSLGAVRVIMPIRATLVNVLGAIVAVAIVVGPQIVAGAVTNETRETAETIFEPVAEGGAWVPDATPPPVEVNDPDFEVTPSESPSLDPSAGPSASASLAERLAHPRGPRINVLLIGMDSGAGRSTALTDTMIVASLDPVGKTVSMVSIPRDMVDVPLPDGRSFRGKINSLVSYARWPPGKFPGSKDGQSVLAAALGELLHLKIDKWAQVNLGGFVYLVDSVGGVNVNVTDGFCDPRYKEYGIKGFNISPGRYHFDGQQALAYARVRKAAGNGTHPRRPPAGGHRRAARQDRPRRVPREPAQVPQVRGPDDPDEHQAVVHRGLDRGRKRGRAQGHLPHRHRAPARPRRLRPARLDPGPEHQEDPRACEEALHARRRAPRGLRHDAVGRVRAHEVGRQVVHVRHRADAPRHAQAHAEAHAEVDTQGHAETDTQTDAQADTEAPADRADPRAQPQEPTPTPAP